MGLTPDLGRLYYEIENSLGSYHAGRSKQLQSKNSQHIQQEFRR